MARVYLVHWHDGECHDLAAPLRAAGYDVCCHSLPNRAPSWGDFETEIAVISLARLPAHGREVADWVWSARKRRHLPVVFADGKPEKVAETKARFPDAIYCNQEEIVHVVDDIVSGGRSTAPAPKERRKTAECAKSPSATPLAKKLGIVGGVRFALLNAPAGFVQTLNAPPEATSARSFSTGCDVVLIFARSAAEMTKRLGVVRRSMKPTASVWLVWPKRTSGIATDLTDEVVRQLGLRSELVDVKVCAINETWSGLKFVVRLADRPTQRKAPPKK